MFILYKTQPFVPALTPHTAAVMRYFITLHSEELFFFFVPLYHFAADHSSGVQMVRPGVDFMPASVRIMDRLLTRSNQTLPPPPAEMTFGCVFARAPVCTDEHRGRRETKTLRQTDTQTVLILFKYLSYPHKAAAGPNSNTQWHGAFSKSFHSMEVNWRQHVYIYPHDWCVTLYRKQQEEKRGDRANSSL